MNPQLLNWMPDSPVQLDRAALLTNLRRARKGAAPGPSGFTAEILRVVLDADDSTHAFADVASLFAQAQVPEDMRAALGLGRMVALRKPTGGTRGLVIGDFLRRLVAPTLAQQFAPSLEEACRPHQYALDNRAGLDALVHHVQPGARCALDPTLTVVGISRQATLHELRNLPEARGGCPTAVREVVAWAPLFFFLPLFLRVAARFNQRITQAEGIEQGDPLSTALFFFLHAPFCDSYRGPSA